ncbi:hypothetical protein uav_101 [Pseudomonas phage UAVern]|uniref:Uncharacterized protein n=1 Tax=Pseudomonas phage UAVern TaxID=2856997 RepID=A0A975UWS5_9CAUD|nr:hypothetical protein uav_101 [Pseudomonas phage UAVern]
MQEQFGQDWEIYLVLTAERPMATYVELDTVCNVQDLHNMLEILEVKHEFDEVARIRAEQERAAQK